MPSFTLNPITAVKNDVIKELGGEHAIVAKLEKLEAAFEATAVFFSHFDAGDVASIAALLPIQLRGKLPSNAIADFSSAVVGAPGLIREVEADLKALETQV